MKLAREEVPFVRLGREAGVHPAVRPWLPGGERYPQRSTREWARLADAVPVVGGSWDGVCRGRALWRTRAEVQCVAGALPCLPERAACLPTRTRTRAPRSLAPPALA